MVSPPFHMNLHHPSSWPYTACRHGIHLVPIRDEGYSRPRSFLHCLLIKSIEIQSELHWQIIMVVNIRLVCVNFRNIKYFSF